MQAFFKEMCGPGKRSSPDGVLSCVRRVCVIARAWRSMTRRHGSSYARARARCRNPMFNGGRQQDSHEVLRTIVDGLREEVLQSERLARLATTLKGQ